VSEFPHSHMDRRPRKRPRLAWELPQPQHVKVLTFFFFFLSNFLIFSFFFIHIYLGEICIWKNGNFFRMINFLVGIFL
jgi:hypothetical protein